MLLKFKDEDKQNRGLAFTVKVQILQLTKSHHRITWSLFLLRSEDFYHSLLFARYEWVSLYYSGYRMVEWCATKRGGLQPVGTYIDSLSGHASFHNNERAYSLVPKTPITCTLKIGRTDTLRAIRSVLMSRVLPLRKLFDRESLRRELTMERVIEQAWRVAIQCSRKHFFITHTLQHLLGVNDHMDISWYRKGLSLVHWYESLSQSKSQEMDATDYEVLSVYSYFIIKMTMSMHDICII